MKATVAGRHLWKVKTSGYGLWITTTARKPAAAGRAAEKYAKENGQGQILSIKWRGTLDV